MSPLFRALLVLPLVAAALGAEPAPVPPPKTFDLAAIDAWLAGQTSREGHVGLSVAILRDGKIVFAKGYGKSSLDPAQPVTPDTAFAIGSVTKQFTSACILLLAEEGKLSVADPVAKYFPGLTRAKEITLHDLMSHVSGYADYYPLDFIDRRMLKSIEPDKLIAEYAGGPLDFEPGTRWSYSNTGYTILGRIIEKVSGEPFGAFLEKRILKPLAMKHSRFEPAASAPGLAHGYASFALGPPEPAAPEAGGWIYAAGGLWASASDLARWDLALTSGKVLKPESYQLMISPRPLKSGKLTDYGCGLRSLRRDGELILTHSGAVSGFHANNVVAPRLKSAVVVLANSEQVDTGAMQNGILGLLLAEHGKSEAPSVPKVKGPPPDEAGLDFLHQMQAGKLERGKLGEEFSIYLTEERVKAAAARLKPLGEPDKVEVGRVAERGGMEVASLRFKFKDTVISGLLYRSPDGKIQQLLFSKE